MYKKVKVLNKQEDKNLKFKKIESLEFAQDLNMIPVSFSEVKHVCCDFPVVFVGKEEPVLAMIVKMKANAQNAAIDENGKWSSEYVPAYLRRYPFILAKTGESFSLAIDEEYGCFSEEEGEAMFDENGEPVEWLKKHMEFLEQFEKEFQLTKAMAKELSEKGLLEEAVLTFGDKEHPEKIGGFEMIDWKKVTELEDETLADWTRRGWIELMTLQQLSMKNFRKLAALANVD